MVKEFRDWADSPRAYENFPYDEVDEPPSERESAAREHIADALEFGRRLVSYIRGQDRSRLTVDCLYLALGDAALEGVTMTSIAQRHGISKAAVSKRTRLIRQHLHLPRTGYNKSEAACAKYAISNYSHRSLERQ